MRTLCLLLPLFVAGCGGAIPPTVKMLVAAQADPAGPLIERKVIETVHLDVRVDAVDAVARQLPVAVSTAKGYIADSHVAQSQHSGSWTIRIPAEQLPAFLESVKQYGVVQSQRLTAEDVTEQFIDVSARLNAKRVEEERLLKLLEEGTGNLADVLAVEQQLQRVRQEIEQAQGRVRYLEHATQYATVHLRVHELFGVSWSDGQPLGAQVVAVVRSSINVLLLVGRGLLIAVAALIPWLIVLSIPTVLICRWYRRFRSVRRTRTAI
jgi:hypothetical protein